MVETKKGIEEEYQGFIGILKETVKEISGKGGENKGKKREAKEGQAKNRGQPKKWWDYECEEAIMQRKKMLQEFKKKKTLHSFIEYKKNRVIVTKVINAKKRESFNQFCASIKRFTGMTYVWNTMWIFKNVKKNINWNSWPTKNREEEIRKEIDKLAPPRRQPWTCVKLKGQLQKQRQWKKILDLKK